MSWLKKTSSIPTASIKELFLLTKKITGLPFKNKHFKDQFSYRTETPDKHYEFAISGDILVVSAWADPIPNFDRLVSEIKKRFGDVHVTSGTYINARRFGLPELQPSVSASKSMAPLPKIVLPEKLNTENASEIFRQINSSIQDRQVSVQGKPQTKRISSFGDYSVIDILGKMYVYDGMSVYAVINMDDARQLIRLSEISFKLSRALEVADWKNQDFSSPY